jgi:molybdopterin synthase catalytic subunit
MSSPVNEPSDAAPRPDDISVLLTDRPLSPAEATSWVTGPGWGAVVTFEGTVRDHAEGRPGVVELEYEAYCEQVEPRLLAIAGEAQRRWPEVGKLVLWHRVGVLTVTDGSVVVAVSAVHRGDAFDAARYCIDTLKATVPIWKRERWAGGDDWGTGARQIMEVRR